MRARHAACHAYSTRRSEWRVRLYCVALLAGVSGLPGSAFASDAIIVEIPTTDGTPVALRMSRDVPPGRLIDVGSHRLHLLCVGQGAPTVVLDAGLGGLAIEWLPVQRELARELRVCAYDRAGYGWSDPGPAPRSTQRLATELASLLDAAGEPAPYLLAGHSFGGYTAQYFARVHPDRTAGIVLVDSSHPDQFNRFPRSQQDLLERLARGRQIAVDTPAELPDNFPADLHGLAQTLMAAPKSRRAQRLEYRNFRKSGQQVLAAGPMPDVPAAILTRGEREWPPTSEGDAMEALWPALQSDLAQAIPRAVQSTVQGSGHHIHLDRPVAVADAIRSVASSSVVRKR